jgi:xanthine/uracil/vitamin C permease (AzgA family)
MNKNLIYLAAIFAIALGVWRVTVLKLEGWIARDIPAGIDLAVVIGYLLLGAMAARHFGLL